MTPEERDVRDQLRAIRDQLVRIDRRVNRLPTSQGIMLGLTVFFVVLVFVRSCGAH